MYDRLWNILYTTWRGKDTITEYVKNDMQEKVSSVEYTAYNMGMSRGLNLHMITEEHA
jgi:hypothetical protein